jgi:uncharacterized protein YhbP (UPF0306 family)
MVVIRTGITIRLAGISLARVRAIDPGGRTLSATSIAASRVRRSVEQILNENVLCSMATLAPARRPHINIAYFTFSSSLELFFLSDPQSVHCRNVVRQPWMSIAVYSTRQEWGKRDRGLQLTGTCRQTRGSVRELAQRNYSRRFPRYRQFVSDAAGSSFARYRLYRFVPSRLKVLDERALGDGVLVTASVHLAPTRRRRSSSARSE